MVTTIQVDEDVKEKLDSIKVYRRETYNELIEKLIENFSAGDKESLIETIEVMSDPETMRDIAEGLEEFRNGKGKTLEQVEKELGLD